MLIQRDVILKCFGSCKVTYAMPPTLMAQFQPKIKDGNGFDITYVFPKQLRSDIMRII